MLGFNKEIKISNLEFIPNSVSKSLIFLGNNDIRDNAQFIMLLCLEHFKIKIINKNQVQPVVAPTKNSDFEKVFKEGRGIMLGKTSGMYGEVEYYLNGIPLIYDSEGNQISSSKEFERKLKEKADLHYDSLAFIKPYNISNDNYYGVFYTLRDAIHIVSQNDIVKVGEVTS